MPKSKTQQGKSILYVKARSLNDLARLVCNFDYTAENLVLTKDGKGYRLLALGECIGDVTLSYYVNVPGKERLMQYTMPGPDSDQELSRFVSTAGERPSHYISIIETDLSVFKEAKDVTKKAVVGVRMGTFDDLISAVIMKAVRGEFFPHVYAFSEGSKTVFGAFDVFEELADDRKAFYYTVADYKKSGNFARYSYNTGKIDITDRLGEHAYMYVKIISLAEKFPFFKMPD